MSNAHMFDIGRNYEIHFLQDGAEVASTWRVEQWGQPLLRVSRPGAADTIFNTASHSFLRAIPQPFASPVRDTEAQTHMPVEAAEMDVVATGVA